MDVVAPVIVAALVSGNDTVGVIDTVSDDAIGGWERLIARACSHFQNRGDVDDDADRSLIVHGIAHAHGDGHRPTAAVIANLRGACLALVAIERW